MIEKHRSQHDAWNEALVDVNRASRGHAFLLILSYFHNSVENLKTVGSSEQAVLRRLVALFGLYWMESDLGDFTADVLSHWQNLLTDLIHDMCRAMCLRCKLLPSLKPQETCFVS